MPRQFRQEPRLSVFPAGWPLRAALCSKDFSQSRTGFAKVMFSSLNAGPFATAFRLRRVQSGH
jgi:hypothetical protein